MMSFVRSSSRRGFLVICFGVLLLCSGASPSSSRASISFVLVRGGADRCDDADGLTTPVSLIADSVGGLADAFNRAGYSIVDSRLVGFSYGDIVNDYGAAGALSAESLGQLLLKAREGGLDFVGVGFVSVDLDVDRVTGAHKAGSHLTMNIYDLAATPPLVAASAAGIRYEGLGITVPEAVSFALQRSLREWGLLLAGRLSEYRSARVPPESSGGEQVP